MKFTVNKKELSEGVNNIIRAVSTKSTIPALEGILIETKNGTIELTAYNLEIGMKTCINSFIQENGKIVLSAKLFSEIVRKAPNEIISITTDEKLMATIESGESYFNLVGINPEEFPELPSIGSFEKIKISGDMLRGMIRQTIFAVAENDAKPINQGSLFNFENNMFELVSVDGYRLAIRREKIETEFNTSFIVPGKTLSEVLKLCTENEIEMIPGRRHIMFNVENYTIISAVLEGEFLDYKNAVPEEFNTEVIVKTRDLIESTERVSLLIADRLKSPVRCYFENGKINLSCTTAIGRAKDKLNCQMTGANIEMGFNNKYLLDALKNSECDSVKMQIVGNINPMIIRPLEGDDFTFLVLPVRLKNEK